MKKKILFLSILCLLFVTLSYTYSSFNNTIVGTITANVKDWVFKVSVDNGTIKDGGYNLHLSGTSGSFNVDINTTGSKSGADYTIELIGDSSIKFYKDSSYTKLIGNNIYSGFINNNTSGSVTIYYKSDTAINSDILIKTKGIIMEIATMKNGYSWSNGGTEFWSDNYKPYIKTINFGNDLSNLPSTCNEENLCWDISESTTQKKKVYGYLVDTGLKDSTDNTKSLYNLYIVSEKQIFAPSNCESIFSFGNETISNLMQINFNNNFNTANVTDMMDMFKYCKSLTNLDLSSFNTSKVKYMGSLYTGMFTDCSKLTNLYISNFDTSNVRDMGNMFYNCSLLTSLDLSNFNTVNVTDMHYMFYNCSSLTSLDLNTFNTSNVTNMDGMFQACSSLTNLDLSSFNTSKVKYMGSLYTGMFTDCSKLTNLYISNFDTSNVRDMGNMFYNCSSLTSLDLSNFNTANVTNVWHMFDGCSKIQTQINIMMHSEPEYLFMFSDAATESGSQITVNYIADASALVDNMIAEKSSNSNVIKGNIIPEYSITITGNDDIKCESFSRVKGTKITLTSISGNNYVTSFKMNGTIINGNEFTIPDTDVTISDIVTISCKKIESAHNPYPNSQDNVIIGELTFEGAKSLTVTLDYQTQSTNIYGYSEYDYNSYHDYFLIYDSSSSTTGINNNKKYGGRTRTQETITINSNYIKITFTSDSSGNNYYGLRALVIPNY